MSLMKPQTNKHDRKHNDMNNQRVYPLQDTCRYLENQKSDKWEIQRKICIYQDFTGIKQRKCMVTLSDSLENSALFGFVL